MVKESVNLLELLRKQAAGGDLDFLREAVAVLAEAVMEAEVSAQIGAGHGERITRRNGYRARRWDTRAGSIELQIPKLRQGSYFPALLDPRRRAERAQLAVVTTSAGSGGSISPAPGRHTYNHGARVTVTATPSSGYRIGSWSGSCSGSGSTCTVTMTGNRTASVSFVLKTYTLTTSAGSGGSISPAPGRHTYNHGARVTVTATPSSGYRIGSWGGSCSGTGSTCRLTMTGNRTASVSFVLKTYTLTTSAGTGGSISPAPGRHTYNHGARVTVTATPSSGYRIGSWGGSCSGSGSTCTVTMTGNRTASVSFVRQYTLTTSAGSGGSISPAPGRHTYDRGTRVTVGVAASTGYRIGTWGGSCSGASGGTCSLTMNGNRSASISFVRQYTLLSWAGSGGSVSPSGRNSHDAGTSVTLTATANSGYRIGSWSGNCSGTGSTCRLTMTGNRTASVSFVRQYTLTTSADANGTTDPSPGSYKHDTGSSVTVTASSTRSNWVFTGWTGASTSTSSSVTLTMSANRSLHANFDHICNIDPTFPACARSQDDEEGGPSGDPPDE